MHLPRLGVRRPVAVVAAASFVAALLLPGGAGASSVSATDLAATAADTNLTAAEDATLDGADAPDAELHAVAATGTASSFTDMDGSPFADDARWLAGEGLTSGCTADGARFCPGQPVSRAQMAVFLAEALDLDDAADPGFADVRPDSVFAGHIARLAAAGITGGCGDGATFCPDEAVSRGQMAVFLARGFGFEQVSDVTFDDVEPTSSYEPYINRIATAGVTTGCRGGQALFCPSTAVSRGQMAAFLRRAVTAAPAGTDRPAETDGAPVTDEPSPTLEPAPASSSREGTPGAHNTGVPDGTSLRRVERIRTSHDGEVIDGVVTTGIEVHHDDVTIRNTRIEGEGTYGIYVPSAMSGDVEGLLIEDTEIVAVSGDRVAGLAQYGDWVARRLEVSGYQDAVKVGSDQVLEDSWLHDLYRPSGAHPDGIQTMGGDNVIIRNNHIEAVGANAAMIIQSDKREVVDYHIEGNLVSGGNYTLYLRDKNYGPPRDVVVRDNIWVDDTARYGPVSLDEGPGLVWENNVFEDGSPVR